MITMLDRVLLRRLDRGEICVYDKKDKFIACFNGGSLLQDLVFNDYELDEFTIIENDSEIESVLAEARAAWRSGRCDTCFAWTYREKD